MSLEPGDQRRVEQLVQRVRAAWHGRMDVPAGQMTVLSNGLQVTVALEPGDHAGQDDPDELRLWLAVCGTDRQPTFHELQLLIGLVFSASQRGAGNPLAISTGRHTPYLVLCSSRVSHGGRRPS